MLLALVSSPKPTNPGRGLPLFIDGVYAVGADRKVASFPTPAPSDEDVAMVAAKVWRQVTRRLAAGDEEGEGTHEALAQITGASVRGMVATGPRRGCQVMRIGAAPHTVEAWVLGKRCAQVEGFNVHANVAIRANDRLRISVAWWREAGAAPWARGA